MSDKKDYNYFQNMIGQCCKIQNEDFTSISEEELRCNLDLIDEYTDIILEVFLSEGLQVDDEPNEYGKELQDVINYLLELRYAIVD